MYTSNPLDPSVPYQLDKDLDKFLPCGAYYYALSLKKSGVYCVVKNYYISYALRSIRVP